MPSWDRTPAMSDGPEVAGEGISHAGEVRRFEATTSGRCSCCVRYVIMPAVANLSHTSFTALAEQCIYFIISFIYVNHDTHRFIRINVSNICGEGR
jgi:hypothetical protein